MLALVLVTDFLLLLTVAACVRLLWTHPHPRHELIFHALSTLEGCTSRIEKLVSRQACPTCANSVNTTFISV